MRYVVYISPIRVDFFLLIVLFESNEINVFFFVFVAANQKETGGRGQAPRIPVRQAERAVGEQPHTAHVLPHRR